MTAVNELDCAALKKRGVLSAGDKSRYYRGKVRDILDYGEHLFIYTTDRISAFDRVLAAIPRKGEILNQLSLFWFRKTEDVIRNHIVKEVTPRSVIVKKCSIVPIEVVVRGYLTGSAWRDYKKGNPVSGITLPPGMKMNQRFREPIITPSTKAEKGLHDEPVSREEIIRRGIVGEDLWDKIEASALALFKRGTELASARGLILVDTKYEFGMNGEHLYVVDEIHTQDSSRYWYADGYEERFGKGEDQRELDKEFFRKWLMARGYMGDGTPPEIDKEIAMQIFHRYREAFSIITGAEFVPASLEPEAELDAIAQTLNEIRGD
ncbi:MAG: phosphoribosylaminoimidazolesuccinocarboxamide synthase [Spirochaetales bacterium]|nr:phosphoribosylaminoimidazolesuccinocarboxamide synthase [Spirochaetales bacterium]